MRPGPFTLLSPWRLGIAGAALVVIGLHFGAPLRAATAGAEIGTDVPATLVLDDSVLLDMTPPPSSASESGVDVSPPDLPPEVRERLERVYAVKAARDSVLVHAWRQRGVPYVWGGTTTRGFDCSGLLQYAFRQAGLQIPRTAREQARIGRELPRDVRYLAPGDLITFQAGTYIDHIGIYIGNGHYVHASGSADRVTVGNLLDPKDRTRRYWVGARRIFLLPYRGPGGEATSELASR